MIGVVLSGGQSTRMGSDKGLLLKETQQWVIVAREKLLPFFDTVVIAINASQLESYAAIIDKQLLVADNLQIEANGPLHGILSVHKDYPAEDLLVLASDMVVMSTEVLAYLLSAYRSFAGSPCYVYKDADGFQPLCAIYSAGLLATTLKAVERGRIEKFSMKHLLESTEPLVIDLQHGWQSAFANYNQKEDIDFQ